MYLSPSYRPVMYEFNIFFFINPNTLHHFTYLSRPDVTSPQVLFGGPLSQVLYKDVVYKYLNMTVPCQLMSKYDLPSG